MICNSYKTLQQCLQQRRRNASLQQLYNKGNNLGMGVVGRQSIPTQWALPPETLHLKGFQKTFSQSHMAWLVCNCYDFQQTGYKIWTYHP